MALRLRLALSASVVLAMIACGSSDPTTSKAPPDDGFDAFGGAAGTAGAAPTTTGGSGGAIATAGGKGGSNASSGGNAGAATQAGSSGDDGDDGDDVGGAAGAAGGPPVATIPPSSDGITVKTTLDVTLHPAKGPSNPREQFNPADFGQLASYLDEGWGDQVQGPGEMHTTRTIDTMAPPAMGANAKMLTRFAHMTDFQIADDESPTRFCDEDAAIWPSMRPQDGHLCQLGNAAVRTVNALNRQTPIDFVLLGGDSTENAMKNELGWVLGIFDGSPSVKCDSGDANDPVLGPHNDGKDPFFAEGFKIPWKWVTGNHDVLVSGNFPVSGQVDIAAGTTASFGTRDYLKGGAIVNDGIVADPKRIPQERAAVMTDVSKSGDGHGIGPDQIARGKAYYSFDIPNTPLRFLVIDSATEDGIDQGVIYQKDFDEVIKPTLDDAKANGKWVILASHHASMDITDDGGDKIKKPGAMEPTDYLAALGSYDNILYSMVAHTHLHQVKPAGPTTAHQWWEVMTSAIADYPHELRTVEIWDGDNGWVMLRATCVDLYVDDDPVAAEGRRRGVADYATGWIPPPRTGETEDRNVELWIQKPSGT